MKRRYSNLAKNSPQDIKNREYFSRKLNEVMSEKGIRQVDLHNNLEIPKSTITGYVKGRSLPTLVNLEKISNFLNVKKSFLDLRFTDNITLDFLKEQFENGYEKDIFDMIYTKIKEVLDFDNCHLNMDYLRAKFNFDNALYSRIQQSPIINPEIQTLSKDIDFLDDSEENLALIVSKISEAKINGRDNILTMITNTYIDKIKKSIKTGAYKSNSSQSDVINLINCLNNKIESYGSLVYEIIEIIEKIGVKDKSILGYILQSKITSTQNEINNLLKVDNFGPTVNNIYKDPSLLVNTIDFDYYVQLQSQLNEIKTWIEHHFNSDTSKNT